MIEEWGLAAACDNSNGLLGPCSRFDLEWYEKILNAKLVDWRPQWGEVTGGKMDDITVVTGYVDLADASKEIVEDA